MNGGKKSSDLRKLNTANEATVPNVSKTYSVLFSSVTALGIIVLLSWVLLLLDIFHSSVLSTERIILWNELRFTDTLAQV